MRRSVPDLVAAHPLAEERQLVVPEQLPPCRRVDDPGHCEARVALQRSDGGQRGASERAIDGEPGATLVVELALDHLDRLASGARPEADDEPQPRRGVDHAGHRQATCRLEGTDCGHGRRIEETRDLEGGRAVVAEEALDGADVGSAIAGALVRIERPGGRRDARTDLRKERDREHDERQSNAARHVDRLQTHGGALHHPMGLAA